MTCSGEMVFFSDLLQISLASEDIRWMNSVQQFTTSSRASLATRTLGRVSLIILLIAALGIVRSSSLPDEEAIVIFLSLSPRLKNSPVWSTTTPRRIFKRPPSESDPRGSMRRGCRKRRWAGTRGPGTPRVGDLGRGWKESQSAEDTEDGAVHVGEEKQGGQEIWAPGNTFVSPQRGGRCCPTGPQRCRSSGKLQGQCPRWGTGGTPRGLSSTEPEPPLLPPPAAAAAASAKPSFRHPRRCLTTCRPQPLLEPGRPPGNEYGRSQTQGTRHWRLPWPFSQNADRGSRSRGNGGPSWGQGRFVGSLSRHPLRHRKPRPPPPLHLPSLLSSGCGCGPSPTCAGGNRPSWRPWIPLAAFPARAPASCSFIGSVAGKRAPHGLGEPLVRACSGAAAPYSGWGVDRRGWIACAVAPPAEASKPFSSHVRGQRSASFR